MALGSVLYSAVGPYLFLTGLTTTDVPTSVIIQRMESLNFLVLSYFVLKAEVSYWSMFNGLLTFCGIVLAIVSPLFWGELVGVSTGALYILGGGYAYSASLIISKKYLAAVPVGVLAVFRVLVGTVLYHLLMLATGADTGVLLSAKLWYYMVPYSLVYVFAAQALWLLALLQAQPTSISVGTTCQFVLSLAWSAALVGTLPTKPQWVGSVVLTVSILSGMWEAVSRLRVQEQEQLLLHHGTLSSSDGASAAALKLRAGRGDYTAVGTADEGQDVQPNVEADPGPGADAAPNRVMSSEFDPECVFRGF